MNEEKSRPYRFTVAVGKDLSKSLENLSSEIMNDGAISTKEKSLIALACAVAVKCEHCVKAHKKKALDAGATMDEILEAAAVAGLVRLGSGFTTASYLLEEE
ncbi:MAG: Alkyl hydroperoxide reductase AhpD [Methanobacterium sp. PtaU1.Bin242]|nr:MAG: Alkyl hydroperoxide reductase AhpD [Methanobacterium sp. PtaU1.Bin242]